MLRFATMAMTADRMQRASVKAVGEGYPLLGELRISDAPGEPFAERLPERTQNQRNQLRSLGLASRTARDATAIAGGQSCDGLTRPIARAHGRKMPRGSRQRHWGKPESPLPRPRGVVARRQIRAGRRIIR